MPVVATEDSRAIHPQTIAQRQLRNDNAEVTEAVVAGESFVVTRNGVQLRNYVRSSRRAGPLCLRLSFWCSPPLGHGSTENDSERISIGLDARAALGVKRRRFCPLSEPAALP